MPHSSLRRIYAFSDTYGRSKNPFIQDDADALISTDFRSFPLDPIRREFDIYGRERVVDHTIRLVFALHDQIADAEYLTADEKKEFNETVTGVFINAAPRTDTKENGAPFYLAIAPGIRIVTTNLGALSSVKDRIQTLQHLNNDQNPIYGKTEQFRSSYTAYLLHEDHGIDMIDDSLDLIPDEPEDLWELSYVDRFGNLMTHTKNPEKLWKEIQELSSKQDNKVKIVIGNVSQLVEIGSSLKDASPGSLVVYLNGEVDIHRKWEAGEDSMTRLYQSSFFLFGKPQIGSEIKIPKLGS